MKLPKRPAKGRALIVVSLVGCAVLISLIVFYSLQSPPKENSQIITVNIPVFLTQEVPAPTEIDYALPVRLKIPNINVNAVINPMGLTSEGDMESPTDPQTVGWYKFGPHPGHVGSAVITGHYGPRRDGKRSIFDDLQKISKGDKIYVDDEKGATAVFVVRESRSYDPEANTSEIFISNDSKPHLNLITCEGIWNESQKMYSSRLVVFADME